jgi:hypothetical protein
MRGHRKPYNVGSTLAMSQVHGKQDVCLKVVLTP